MKPVTIALFLALASAVVHGQVITGSLEGTVLDPAGAVPNAKVRAVNGSTNLKVHAVTDSDGRYTFPSLPPGGPYSVTVTRRDSIPKSIRESRSKSARYPASTSR